MTPVTNVHGGHAVKTMGHYEHWLRIGVKVAPATNVQDGHA